MHFSFYFPFSAWCESKEASTELNPLLWESIINQCPTGCLCGADGVRRWAEMAGLAFWLYAWGELISFLFHSQKEAFTKKRHPAKSIHLQGSAYCSGAMKTINTWLLFTMIWQCTMAQGLSCHQDLESISLPFPCYRREGGFLVLIGQGSSIWNFWSGGPLWTKLRWKPSDVAIYRAADENKETAFDIVCPSICPQTNRMKAWPLIRPCLLPFSLRPTAKQLRPSEKILSRPPHLCTRER